MKIKENLPGRIFDIVNVVLLFLVMMIIIVPIVNILFSSLSDPIEVMKQKGMLLWPKGFNLDSYKAVLRNPNILNGYKNTLFVVFVGTSINIVLTLLAAYVLSRKDVLWRNPLTMIIVFTMYFNGGMIPFYLVVKGAGLDGTIWSLIVPSAINTYNLIIMRTAMVTVPESMSESAKIDGAGHWRILFLIMAPLIKATIAVLVLYYGVYHWNSWFHAMIFLREKSMYPLQLILREILIQNDTTSMASGIEEDVAMIGETIKYATIVVATLPILCAYPFLQRYFVKGVMIGAVKG